jgi:hypothetical protein
MLTSLTRLHLMHADHLFVDQGGSTTLHEAPSGCVSLGHTWLLLGAVVVP